MKMTLNVKRLLITIFWVLLFNFTYSQTSTIKIKMETLLKKNTTSAKVYINKASNILELEVVTSYHTHIDYQIPYLNVTFKYDHETYLNTVNDKTTFLYKHFVCMECPEHDNCIKDEFGNLHYSVSITFNTKDDVYTFIDLIDQLKRQK